MFKKSINYLLAAFFVTFLAGFSLAFAYFPKKNEPRIGKGNLPHTPVYLASKNGEVFGLPWCGSMPRIKAENIVILSHKNEAEDRGYRPMKGCRGL